MTVRRPLYTAPALPYSARSLERFVQLNLMPHLSPPAKHNPQRRHRKEQNYQGDGNKDNRHRHFASQTSSDALDYTASDGGSQPSTLS